MTTQFQLHVEGWKNCDRCRYADTRNRVVFARGSGIPADVCFVGQAPGKTEDVDGDPFTGPTRPLIDSIIAESIPDSVSYALTNLVGCLPVEEGVKDVKPEPDCIEACAPKLVEFLEICAPRLIVCVGELATNWLNPANKKNIWKASGVKTVADVSKLAIPTISIPHPAHILRKPSIVQGIDRRKCIIAVSEAIEKYLVGEGRVE